MIPESNIRSGFTLFDLYIGRFPQSQSASLPRGVIRRGPGTPINTKGVTADYHQTIFEVLIYDKNAVSFNSYYSLLETVVEGLPNDKDISHAYIDERDQGYVLEDDELEWMTVDIIVEHKNVE